MRWLLGVLSVAACGGPDIYRPCGEPADCPQPVDDAFEAECLDKSGEGFCTWTCAADGDCAEIVDDTYPFVCASFESEPGTHCFPSCEDPEGSEDSDPDVCPRGFGCRSTGGGSDNRKVCFPDG